MATRKARTKGKGVGDRVKNEPSYLDIDALELNDIRNKQNYLEIDALELQDMIEDFAIMKLNKTRIGIRHDRDTIWKIGAR